MAQVTASSSTLISAAPDKVATALLDYSDTRRSIAPDQYRNYEILSGGTGAGTVVQWVLVATKKRSRTIRSTVSVDAAAGTTTITETDANSSLVTTYVVAASGTETSVVTTTSWKGAGGVGGFFEKTFAPLGLKKIQAALLANLKLTVEAAD